MWNTSFEGVTGRGEALDLVAGGIYYGFMQNEKRHGFGILYCTDTNGYPYLFELEWVNGAPTKGRRLTDADTYDGELDGKFLFTGAGIMSNVDGSSYVGQWKDGNKHGKGKFTQTDGRTYNGSWKDNYIHGFGRFSYPTGEYYEGEYIQEKSEGVHKWYTKDGKLKTLITFRDNRLVAMKSV